LAVNRTRRLPDIAVAISRCTDLSAELVDARDKELWGEQYSRKTADIAPTASEALADAGATR